MALRDELEDWLANDVPTPPSTPLTANDLGYVIDDLHDEHKTTVDNYLGIAPDGVTITYTGSGLEADIQSELSTVSPIVGDGVGLTGTLTQDTLANTNTIAEMLTIVEW